VPGEGSAAVHGFEHGDFAIVYGPALQSVDPEHGGLNWP
jgi:hypothetical protein